MRRCGRLLAQEKADVQPPPADRWRDCAATWAILSIRRRNGRCADSRSARTSRVIGRQFANWRHAAGDGRSLYGKPANHPKLLKGPARRTHLKSAPNAQTSLMMAACCNGNRNPEAIGVGSCSKAAPRSMFLERRSSGNDGA